MFLDRISLLVNSMCWSGLLLISATVQGADQTSSLSTFANDFLAVPPDVLSICRALFENTAELIESPEVQNAFGKQLNDINIDDAVDAMKNNRPQWMKTFKDCKEKLDVIAVKKNLECIWREGNFTLLGEEVNTAILESRGGLNAVFRDFCRKMPRMFGCIDELVEIFETSQTLEERRFSSAFRRQLDAAQRYLCEEYGGRIALFVGSGGMECVESSSEDIQGCSALKLNKIEDIFSMQGLHNAETYDRRIASYCGDLKSTQSCFDGVLKRRCGNKVVSNLVDGLFRSLLLEQPCVSIQHLRMNSSPALHASFALPVLLTAFLAVRV